MKEDEILPTTIWEWTLKTKSKKMESFDGEANQNVGIVVANPTTFRIVRRGKVMPPTIENLLIMFIMKQKAKLMLASTRKINDMWFVDSHISDYYMMSHDEWF